MNTNWSSPKTNALAGINCLRKALAAGQNARLVRARNEDCAYPIKVKQYDTDFRNYEFSVGHPSYKTEILERQDMTDFEKYLALNYINCYGTEEAMKRYYDKGLLSPDNFKGIGRSHLVKAEDAIRFFVSTGDKQRADSYVRQYTDSGYPETRHMFCFFRYKHGSQWQVKKYRRKLWVVELLGDDEPKQRIPVLVHVLNALVYPLKWIPTKNVLRMDEYKCITFRWGSVINGFSIEFQIPKKFSLN